MPQIVITINGEACYKCKFCNNLFEKRLLYRRHVEKDHKLKRNQCEDCLIILATSCGLITHETTHEAHRHPIFCDICKTTLSTEGNARLHIKHVHDKVPRPKRTAPSNRKRPVRSQKPSYCQRCDSTFKSPAGLAAHMRKHKFTDDSGEKYKCQACPATFKLRRSLNHHVQSIHEGVSHQCGKCKKSFTLKSTLKVHIARKCCSPSADGSSLNYENAIRCGICERWINSKIGMVSHMRSHERHRLAEEEKARQSKLFDTEYEDIHDAFHH